MKKGSAFELHANACWGTPSVPRAMPLDIWISTGSNSRKMERMTKDCKQPTSTAQAQAWKTSSGDSYAYKSKTTAATHLDHPFTRKTLIGPSKSPWSNEARRTGCVVNISGFTALTANFSTPTLLASVKNLKVLNSDWIGNGINTPRFAIFDGGQGTCCEV